jgi:5-methyltetrahydropteroyltriglutamate--homocysteine methyltransferase
MTPTLPAHYDHVGSFLRPLALLEAREQHAKGQITAAALRLVEDHAISDIVKFQQDVGLKSITDGEFRRTYFHIDFLEQLGGVKTDIPMTIQKPDGTLELAPPVMRVVDKVRHVKDIQLADFQYLASQVAPGHTAKVTIPSPTMLHFRGGRAGISREHYPELDPDFYDDVAKAYGDELRSLAAAGCTYVQLDDTNLAYLCDEKCVKRHASVVTTRMSCRTATPPSSTRWWRKSRPACCWPCTCAVATSRARTRPAAITSQWPRRCSAR